MSHRTSGAARASLGASPRYEDLKVHAHANSVRALSPRGGRENLGALPQDTGVGQKFVHGRYFEKVLAVYRPLRFGDAGS